MLRRLAAITGLLVLSTAAGQEMLRVSKSAWSSLSPTEQAAIQARRVVEVREPNTYGVIIDNQGVNESTPGTRSGSTIGSAIAEAAYIDRALKPGNNYSAKNQVAASLLGAIVGSTLDKPPVQQFHFRYAIQRGDGEVQFLDSIQSSAFRLPSGLCVSIPEVVQLSQAVCNATAADLRREHMPLGAQGGASARPNENISGNELSTSSTRDAAPMPASVVSCKLGNLQPITTTTDKCRSIGGTIL